MARKRKAVAPEMAPLAEVEAILDEAQGTKRTIREVSQLLREAMPPLPASHAAGGNRIFRQLPVKLTAEELVTYRDRGAAIIQDLDDLTEHKKTWLQEYNKSRAILVTEQRRIAKAIRDRAEDRSVECEERSNFAGNVVHVHRLDTGEQVDVRPMSATDRQGELYL